MKILVTGGAGFIASHIVDAYIQAGHELVVIDNLSTGRRENLNPRARFYEVDLRDPQVAEIVADERPEVINHHAAQIDVRKSVADPVFDAEVNILASLRLFEAARLSGSRYIIFSSTGGAIYGEQDYFPADENHPLRPLSPYGIAKLAVEKYLDYYNTVHGLNYAVLRYANVYGPRQNPKGEAGVVAIFCERLLKGEQPIINGNGLQTRDYVYVGDVVQANLALLEAPNDMLNSVFNIGTGVETDVVTIFRMLRELFDESIEPLYGPAKLGEQLRSILDIRKAERHLGWRPEIDLAEGLKRTVDFYRA